ncbi:MAG: hypothetical protein ACYCQI_11385 [Gammaproteobacteria bacterium]
MTSQINKEVKEDDLNVSYRVFRPDLVNLLNENHFLNYSDQTLLNLYDLHYLTHPISHLKSYQERHPDGILEIYDNSRKKRNPYFLPLNRGRISNFGYSKDTPSYHLGIFRSVDQTPHDMRKSSLSSSATRCPDRLYMVHPRIARTNLQNWLHQCFANGNNSCYVNGLSGSILLEIRLLLFFYSAVKKKHYQCKFIKDDDLDKYDFALLKNYLRLVIGLFVYFEGGHTFSEILSVFHLAETKTETKAILQSSAIIFSTETLLLADPLIVKLMQESLIETIKFYSVCNLKREVCQAIPLAKTAKEYTKL